MTVNHLYPTTRPTLDLNFARQKRLDPRVTFTRGSTATYVGDDGLIKTAASNEARFDHDPATGESLGLLMETNRTNVLYPSTPDYSGGFGSWSNGSAPLTANAGTAPDGTNTAVLTAWDTVSGSERMYYNTGTPSSVGVTEVHSFFVKAKTPGSGDVFAVGFQGTNWGASGTYRFYFDTETFTGGTADSKTVTKYPDGWYRVSVSMTNSGTGAWNTYVQIQRSQQTGNWYIWGCQREDYPFPTSYIPTSATTVTRAKDLADMTGANFSSWYNQSEGSFHINAKPLYPFQQYIFRTRLTNTIGIGAYFGGNDARSSLYVTGGSGIVNLNLASTIQNFAAAYKDYDFAVAGPNQILTNTTQALPPYSMTGAEIGRSGLSQNLFGHIARIAYYPTRLTNSQLQELTR